MREGWVCERGSFSLQSIFYAKIYKNGNEIVVKSLLFLAVLVYAHSKYGILSMGWKKLPSSIFKHGSK
jgi:hypothetical protein